tara:strand:- start:1458 stop:1715 length:258 start_codon:yes stop_codon:yes gene_type:complete
MDHEKNPLGNITDLQTRHLFMQILAWMWCIILANSPRSAYIFGVTAIVHSLLIAGVVSTVSTFEIAKKQPLYFRGLGRSINGEHE